MTPTHDETWDGKIARIGKYYEALVQEHGAAPRSCDYGRPASQSRKFAAVAGVMPLAGRRVLDVGCGLADFAAFLARIDTGIRYVGVDIAPAMLAQAKALRPEVDVRRLDILEETPEGAFDLVTANGIFYLLGSDAEALMHRLVTRMFALTSHAVAFTSLSTWAPHQEPGEFYADPEATLRFCRTLTPWVVLRHDYALHDFTIYLYKNSPFDGPAERP